MKSTFTIFILMMSIASFSQQKTTGTINFLPNLSASLNLNNSNTTATLTINGPSDRWFAIAIGSFDDPGAMDAGNDLVYYNGTTLIDARMNGLGATPIDDSINNWTVTSNTVLSGTRTIVATRPFVAEATDYTFTISNGSVSLAGAHASSPISASLQYHGGNRFNAGNVSLTTLGLNDFYISEFQIYPNPAKGDFTVKANTTLEKINIYSQSGVFIKTVDVINGNKSVAVKTNEMQDGVYLIELVNGNEKTWKKIIVTN
jgi:hypothetical protein